MVTNFIGARISKWRSSQEDVEPFLMLEDGSDVHPLLLNGSHLLHSGGRTLVVGPNVAHNAHFLAQKGFTVVVSTHSQWEATLLSRIVDRLKIEVRVEVIYDASIEHGIYDNVVALDSHYIPSFRRSFVLRALSDSLRVSGALLYSGANLLTTSDELDEYQDLLGAMGSMLDFGLMVKTGETVVDDFISEHGSFRDGATFLAYKV